MTKSFRSPQGVRAGELLRAGQWDAAHAVAQDLATPEGSFWHGILHRHEPDPGNAAYWFRRTGRHPVFPSLRAAAAAIEPDFPECRLGMGLEWDPFRWIDFWERAKPGTREHAMAKRIDEAEWRILMDYCSEEA